MAELAGGASETSESVPGGADEITLLNFRTKFQGRDIDLHGLDALSTVRDLKRLIQDETSVPIVRQKLLGLVKGKLPPEDATLASLLNYGMVKVW